MNVLIRESKEELDSMRKRDIIIPLFAFSLLGLSTDEYLEKDNVHIEDSNLVVEVVTDANEEFDIYQHIDQPELVAAATIEEEPTEVELTETDFSLKELVASRKYKAVVTDVTEEKLELVESDRTQVATVLDANAIINDCGLVVTTPEQDLARQLELSGGSVSVSYTQATPFVLSYNNDIDLRAGETLTLDMLNIQTDTSDSVSYDFSSKVYNEIGDFTETITATNNVTGYVETLTVNVSVVDKTAPVIKGVKKTITFYKGQKTSALLEGIKATDNVDKDVEVTVSKINTKLLNKKQKVTFTAKDDSGNVTKKTAYVIVKKDTKAPVIKGVKNITVLQGETINLKKGVTATDNADGKITSKIKVSKYNKNLIGKKQKITYTVKDKAGNITKKTAYLTIKKNPVQKINKYMWVNTVSGASLFTSEDRGTSYIGVDLPYLTKVYVISYNTKKSSYKVKYNDKTYYIFDKDLVSTKPVVNCDCSNCVVDPADYPNHQNCNW